MALPESTGFSMEIEYEDMPSRTFIIDKNSNQIVGISEGLPAMTQAVDVILNSERFRWQIYGSDYGVELDSLIGKEYDYIISEFPRRVKDSFSVDDRILDAENFVFTRNESSMTVTFDVITVYGTVSREVEI